MKTKAKPKNDIRGTMLVLDPSGTIAVTKLEAVPDLKLLQQTVGGYIEAIPGFNWITHNNVTSPCVAYCDEDGRRKHLEYNVMATAFWYKARGLPPEFAVLDCLSGHPENVITGKVVVIYGSKKLMSRL